MNTTDKLRRLFDGIFRDKSFSRADLVYAFVLARQHIEESEDSLTNYPTIRLYADWLVHTKLDRGGAKRILQRLRDVLREDREKPPRVWDWSDPNFDDGTLERVNAINQVFGFARLRAEWLSLCSSCELNSKLFTIRGNWYAWVGCLHEELEDKRLVWIPAKGDPPTPRLDVVSAATFSSVDTKKGHHKLLLELTFDKPQGANSWSGGMSCWLLIDEPDSAFDAPKKRRRATRHPVTLHRPLPRADSE